MKSLKKKPVEKPPAKKLLRKVATQLPRSVKGVRHPMNKKSLEHKDIVLVKPADAPDHPIFPKLHPKHFDQTVYCYNPISQEVVNLATLIPGVNGGVDTVAAWDTCASCHQHFTIHRCEQLLEPRSIEWMLFRAEQWANGVSMEDSMRVPVEYRVQKARRLAQEARDAKDAARLSETLELRRQQELANPKRKRLTKPSKTSGKAVRPGRKVLHKRQGNVKSVDDALKTINSMTPDKLDAAAAASSDTTEVALLNRLKGNTSPPPKKVLKKVRK